VALFATKAPNGDIAWTTRPERSANIVTLAGQPAGTISSPTGPIDPHELQFLPDGDYLVAVNKGRCCYDLSSWGGPSSATIVDQIVQELSPSGTVVWSWDSADHINPVIETDPEWRQDLIGAGPAYDVFHLNSLDYSNGDVLISYRALDAVYDVKQADGSIFWKLSGHTDPESLTVLKDPVFAGGGELCGQHDARHLPDGTITIHDNGSDCNRAPRGVRYAINTTARTATLIGSVTDSRAPSSFCCGSARMTPGGDWVLAWGFNRLFTELKPSGTPVYTVRYPDYPYSSYRVMPIYRGTYTASQLRAAMNAQFPRVNTGMAVEPASR
jgi:outer membrane protein assembly factor BamB